MEFLMVYAEDRGQPLHGIPVLVNGQKNGVTGSPIKVDKGFIELSVDVFGAETVTTCVANTTAEKPQEECIRITHPEDQPPSLDKDFPIT